MPFGQVGANGFRGVYERTHTGVDQDWSGGSCAGLPGEGDWASGTRPLRGVERDLHVLRMDEAADMSSLEFVRMASEQVVHVVAEPEQGAIG